MEPNKDFLTERIIDLTTKEPKLNMKLGELDLEKYVNIYKDIDPIEVNKELDAMLTSKTFTTDDGEKTYQNPEVQTKHSEGTDVEKKVV